MPGQGARMSRGSWIGWREAGGRRAELVDAGVWPGGKEETRRATEGLQNMEGSRNGPTCRPEWGEAGGQSAPGIQESRFQRSHIPRPGRVVCVFSQGPWLVAGLGLHPEHQ